MDWLSGVNRAAARTAHFVGIALDAPIPSRRADWRERRKPSHANASNPLSKVMQQPKNLLRALYKVNLKGN
jgi:hypothetical protein